MRRAHTVLFGLASVLFATGAAGATFLTPSRPAGADPAPIQSRAAAAQVTGRVADQATTQVAAWQPQAVTPAPGAALLGPRLWIIQGEAESRALPHESPAVLFVGDSITQWWQTTGRASWDRWFAPLGAAADGVAGDTTSNLLARLDAGEVPAEPPSTIVLLIGTNNISLGQSPEEITKGLEAVIWTLHRRMPPSRIIVLGLLPRGHPSDPERKAAEAVNRDLRDTLRGTGVGYLDVGAALLEPDGRLKPGAMLPDLLHPSALGYALIAHPILRDLRSRG